VPLIATAATARPGRMAFGMAVFSLLLLSACAAPPTTIDVVFYPPPPQTPRIQFLTSITLETDIGKKASNFRKFIVGDVEDAKRLARPYSIAHESGRIYIADKTFKTIIIIDFDNNVFDYIRDSMGGALQDPFGIFITADGNRYVADAGRGQIVVYDQNDDFVRSYGEEGQFRPTSVVVRANRIYVCDIDDNEIEVLAKDSGEVVDTIGGPGSAAGSFKSPTHLALDDDGNLYVTDALNFRVQVFDPSGDFVKVIGYLGSHPGSFVRPKDLDIDREGHLYVADTGFEIIQIFDVNSAEPLLAFGKYGPAPGSTYMPSGVHIDYDNVAYFSKYAHPDFKVEYLVYVGNMLGDHKLNVYGFGEWAGPSLKGYTKPELRAPKDRPETVPSLDDLPDTSGSQDGDSQDIEMSSKGQK